jgi:hypothetical protein
MIELDGRELKFSGKTAERSGVHPEIGQLGRDQGVRKILPQASS